MLRVPISRAIPLREAVLWLVVCLLAHLIVQFVDFRSVEDFARSAGEQNLILWFAIYVCIWRVRQSGSKFATTLDLIAVTTAAAFICLTSIIPHRAGLGLLLAAVGLFAVLRSADDRELRAAGVVLLALSGHLVWGPLLFYLLTPELLSADAALVGALLSEIRPDIIWKGTSFHGPDGHSISLIGACSSFHNVSSAVLASVAVTMFIRTHWLRRDLFVTIALCAVVILSNAIRLCILMQGPAAYEFWHNNIGAQLVALAQTILVLAIAFWSARAREQSA